MINTRRPSLPVFLLLAVVVASPLVGQETLIAPEFFDRVAANYGGLRDYIADLTITDDIGTMSATVYYKDPNKILVEFTNPSEQVIVSDGETIRVYIPDSNVVHEQSLAGRAGAPGVITDEGLTLMRRDYDIRYLEGPEPVPLDEDDPTPVTKLLLERTGSGAGFRELILSIDENFFIRRQEGTRVDWAEVTFDFTNVRVNQALPDGRFDYDPPPSASSNENFLFGDSEG